MSQLILCTPSEFIAKTNDIILPPFKHGYFTISKIFLEHSKIEHKANNQALANALELSHCICSMLLTPDSINDPFKPWFQCENKRSVIADDFNDEQLEFITNVHKDIEQPILKARFADLLWLRANPKSISYAHAAIESYIALPIEEETWHIDIKECWERAVCLSTRIKNIELTNKIENTLLNSLALDFPNSPYINLYIAEIIEKNRLCYSQHKKIAALLLQKACTFHSLGHYTIARKYLFLSKKIFEKQQDKKNLLKCIILTAECFELEGDHIANSDTSDYIAANLFYNGALQTYRNIPKNNRNDLNVTTKITLLNSKIIKTGKNILSEIKLIKISSVNISELKAKSYEHVKDKRYLELALLYFSGFDKPVYQELHSATIEEIKKYPINHLFNHINIANDGRITSKIPAVSFINNEKETEISISKKIIQIFERDMQLYVEGMILPALEQILSEFRVTKDFLVNLCYRSPIVPEGREYLMGSALWHGFEQDFGVAIHLLMPQVEHLVRTLLKNNNIQTTNIDQNGIENENGLSTLLNHEKAKEILGEDLWFEMKAVFTEQVGANLRNNVAHGLLNDETSQSVASIYAWWMILRLIVRAPYEIEIKNENTINEAVDN